MLPKELTKALNDQLTNEYQAAHSYTAMASYLSRLGYQGFANFWLVQAAEEREHGQKFFDFLVSREEQPILGALDEPKSDFESPLEVAKLSLQQEKQVTQNIYDLVDLARKLDEHATDNLLQWFIDEQVGEEKSFQDLITKLEKVEVGADYFMQLDRELGSRED